MNDKGVIIWYLSECHATYENTEAVIILGTMSIYGYVITIYRILLASILMEWNLDIVSGKQRPCHGICRLSRRCPLQAVRGQYSCRVIALSTFDLDCYLDKLI